MRLAAFLVFSLISAPAFAKQSDETKGFACAVGNEALIINIDLKSKRYDMGEGRRKIDQITDSSILLRAPNPDLMGANGGVGPVLDTLILDRRTLLLTHRMLIPAQNVDKTTIYKCSIYKPFDFTAGRKF